MLIDWISFEVRLCVLSPLAIGSGELLPSDGQDVGGVAAVQIGAGGKPCIPATSLKGALRAAMTDTDLQVRLFGDVSRSDGAGSVGRLLLRTALWDEAGGKLKSETSTDRTAEPTFDRPATAIDRDTGAVERGKLFTQRAVKRGAVFLLKGRLLSEYAEDDWQTTRDADIAKLGRVLAPLLSGLPLGRGTRLSYGRVGLDTERMTVLLHRCDPQHGSQQPDDLTAAVRDALRAATATATATGGEMIALSLRCPTPFIIVDPVAVSVEAEPGVSHLQTQAVRTPDGRPMLWPSSLLGALRAKAAWIAEIDRLRQTAKTGAPKGFVPTDRHSDHAADDRFLVEVLGPNQRVVERRADLRRLSSVERLFGVPGWKGGLSIASLVCRSPGAKRVLTSVAIDRLTGGAEDGALYTMVTHEGTEFAVTLAVSYGARAISPDLAKLDRALLDDLVAVLARDGLALGHGEARGFGWFDVRQEETAA